MGDEEHQLNESLKKAVSDNQSRQWTELMESRASTRDDATELLTARNTKLQSDYQDLQKMEMQKNAFLMDKLRLLRDELLSLRTGTVDQTRGRVQLEMRCDALKWKLEEEQQRTGTLMEL